MLGKEFQPRVKSSANVLIGVAQVRIGLPSIRDAVAKSGVLQRVPQSTLKTVNLPSGGTCEVVVPTDTPYTAEATGLPTVSGTYTGAYDGAFIVRKNASGYDVFGPDGAKAANADFATSYELQVGGAASGLTLTGAITGDAEGDTFIIPVWSPEAQAVDNTQTGIVCPYSLFASSNESVGGLASASINFKVDDVKKLTSGFPENVDDSIIAKTSVGVSFESQEFDNEVVKHLRKMMNLVINESQSPAITVEIVCRTRGNKLITYWVPNASLESLPSVAPQNDYSTQQWELASATQTEDGTDEVYNAWLTNAKLYSELNYTH